MKGLVKQDKASTDTSITHRWDVQEAASFPRRREQREETWGFRPRSGKRYAVDADRAEE